MWGYLVFILGTVLTVQAQNVSESKVVQIAQGPVRGYKEPDYDVIAFYEIPYATVTERFKAPSDPPTWNETFDAIHRGILCHQWSSVQFNNITDNVIIQEDCLVVNVFIPSTGETNLPVLINIHGGAFQYGAGTNENHRTLVETKKIVAVNFNYRLGALGFLCLGTNGAPGNAGLKDQLKLLRWVKENIGSFGGNPDDVTISGCSAGSASVDILTLSDTTRGLFTKAISNSGAHLGFFAVQGNPIQNAKDAAKMLDFQNVDDLVELEEFYKNAPVSLLISQSFANSKNGAVFFSPCVEKNLGEEAILLDAPYNILKRGEHVRYPTMYGFTDLEGILRLSVFETWAQNMNEKFSDFLPGDLQFETEEQMEEVAKTIKQLYFGNQPVSVATIMSYLDYFSDVTFVYSMLRSVKLNIATGNSTFYLHEYSFVDNNTIIIPFTNATGALHCAQHATAVDQDERSITEEYRNMKRIMRELWGNFITTGVPVLDNSTLPAWPPAGGDRSPHLSFGSTIELKFHTPLEERTGMWDNIYEKYYRAPIPPITDSATTIRSGFLVFLLLLCYILS